MKRLGALLLAAAIGAAGAAPAAAGPPATAGRQEFCPEMGGPVNRNLYVDYQGKRIYLCCEMCRAAVEKDPERAIRGLAGKGQTIEPIPAAGEPAADATARVRTLGVLLFPGFELLDAFGPMELWGNLGKQVRVVTVAAKPGEIASNQGPKAVADFGYEDAPPLDLLLVPGGRGVTALAEDRATLEWLRARAGRAEITMSVCNGASLLAAAGILDGRPATTNKMFWATATGGAPRVNWVKQARWVDDGAVVTSSGVSAGIDMSLAVIRRLYGEERAAWLERLTEYESHRDPAWDPFAKQAGLAE